MKKTAARIILFFVGGIGIYFSPWITLVAGGLFFAIVFRFPIELLFWAAYFELLSGMPPGILMIPFGITLVTQAVVLERFNMESLLAKGFLLLLSILFFIAVRLAFLFFVFGYSGTIHSPIFIGF